MNKRQIRGILLDLTTPVVVLLLVAILAFIQQMGYQSHEEGGFEDTFISQDAWEALQEDRESKRSTCKRKALLLYDSNDVESVQTSEQIGFVLNSFGVELTKKSIYIPTERTFIKTIPVTTYMVDECSDLIICFSSLISSGIDLNDLLPWINAGGNIIFASGLEAEELFDPIAEEKNWMPLLGISSMTASENIHVDSMILLTSLLAGGKGMEFSDDVIFCDAVAAELTPECEVHIVTADEFHRPLLWERYQQSGHVLVCNADLMDGKTNRGMIASCFAHMNSALVYPVINAAVYCIDDFPSAAPAGFDQNVLSQYGYTVGDFYANVWWPSLQKIAEENDIKYSTFLIQCYDDDVDGPFTNTNNQPSASYYAKQILEMGGEIGLHGYNHQPLVLEGYVFDEKNDGYTNWVTVENMLSSVRAALTYAKTLTPGIEIQSYVAPSNVLSREAMNAMVRQFEDLRIYAGVYIGTSDQLVQEFSVLDEDVVQVPRLTADMQMESSEWWLQVNELNYHYYESNYIHPDDILDEERSDGGDFSAMLSAYENMVKWNRKYGLNTTTITEAAGAVQRYCNLFVEQEMDENGISIHLEGLIDEAFLMLRTEKIPEFISSGELVEIDDGCYIIRTQDQDIRVEWNKQ